METTIKILILISFFSFHQSCDIEKSDTPTQKEKIDLIDGIYLLNGDRDGVPMVRNNANESYLLNPKPFITSEDYKSVDILEESNGMFSVRINLHEESIHKWKKTIEEYGIHYVGCVENNELITVIKVRGEDKQDDVYLQCFTPDRAEIEAVSAEIMPEN
ncbi:MAG: hypothetical protein P1U70_27920 [Saprospiraceae bacterium]|nr:hypothetical protein [Saprospiraceae bacterium]